MEFIAIVVALLVERFWPNIQALRDTHLFQKYISKCRALLGETEALDGPVGVALLLLPALLGVAWIQELFSGGIWALFGLVYAVLVLLAAMGPRNLGGQVEGYVRAMDGRDENRACDIAADILNEAVPLDEGGRDRKIIYKILPQANDWLLAVLFWFALLGPVGAVLYRLAAHLKTECEERHENSGFASASRVLYGLLAWVPARITSFVYGLAGSFNDAQRLAREAQQHGEGVWLANNHHILLGSGLGALQLHDRREPFTNHHVKQALDLIHRTAVIWLTGIAVLTLLSGLI